jgi:asparagine synthase (glutamine-hydrolysing)
MSGIAGIVHFDGRPVEREWLARMTDAIAHRGPDGVAHWFNGSVGLGHRHHDHLEWLHTTPEARNERQPLTDESGCLCLVFDGRIDNRAELKSAINAAGLHLRTDADAEIVLKAYQCWGEDSPRRMLGDFAYALWDGSRRSLFCARDLFGSKPFYYHLTDRLFVFASEVKAILSVPEVPQRLNEARIADYLVEYLEAYDNTSSFFEGIFKLPPAHTAVIGDGRLRLSRYWSPDPHREVRYHSDAEYEEAFREIFTEAVRCRLPSASPPGSMLSGGIDSSSIVCVARELLREEGRPPLHTFSAVSPGGPDRCVETQAINAVLQTGGLEAHTISPEQLSRFNGALDRLLRQMDDPFDSILIQVPMAMYLLAQEQGVNVVLDGVDGDVVASLNYTQLRHHLRAGRWKTAFVRGKAMADFYEESPWLVMGRSLLTTAAYAALPAGWLSEMRLKKRASKSKRLMQDSPINRDFALRVGLNERLESAYRNEDSFLTKSIRDEWAHRLCQPFITVALERYERVAAAYGIEPRHPLFDRRVVEFCLALPWQQHFLNGWTKPIFRRAMKGIIPEAIRWRKNWEHVGPAFSASWLKLWESGVRNAIGRELNGTAEFIDVQRVHSLWRSYESYFSNRISTASDHDRQIVWRSAVLASWLQHRDVKGQ